ncbi:MAG: hypothetical protein DLM61_13790 [Pseudonocardiales bacterium]|nr:MAG: hypothetical protein DLM61_13790 [Pseudonocardiales bacterium]
MASKDTSTWPMTGLRVDQATGRVHYRHSRKRKRLLAHGRGLVTVNDGPAFASQLARYLAGARLGRLDHEVDTLTDVAQDRRDASGSRTATSAAARVPRSHWTAR